MSLSEYKDIFVSEAREYLKTLNDCVLELEENPENLTLLDEMFRAAHSLKGMSGTMGYDQIASLTHHMESIFDEIRNQRIKADKRVVNIVFESLDKLESLLDQVAEGEEEEVISDLIQKLESISSTPVPVLEKEEGDPGEVIPGVKLEGETALEEGEKILQVKVKLEKETMLKSVRAYMVLKEARDLGEVIKTIPEEEELEAGVFGESFMLTLQTRAEPELIKSSIQAITEIEKVEVEAFETAPEKKKKAAAALLDDQQKALLKKTSEKIIRVETDKLDILISLVGELVVNRTRVLELSKTMRDPELKSSMEQLDLITSNLQNAVMKLRMVPIKQVFERFPRLVRDFSQARDKKVNLVILGEETELDRSIVNVIGEPLVHLVRNAMDHGIERSADRLGSGKPEVATIKLEARHEGSHIVIEVSDDGHGIDPRVIRAKSMEKGLKTPEELDRMAEEEIIRLIFHSGFSTAEEVTDISGRGVGMDAVRSTVEMLHGDVNLESHLGKGTKFMIKLPLTLAIIKAMLVKVESEILAIPIESIRENIYVPPADIKHVQNQIVVSYRDEILQLIPLGKRLGLREISKSQENGVLSVVVVEAGDKKAGLVVDELQGQQEIVIKSLGKILEGLTGIAGATVLAHGEVALILDVSSLV